MTDASGLKRKSAEPASQPGMTVTPTAGAVPLKNAPVRDDLNGDDGFESALTPRAKKRKEKKLLKRKPQFAFNVVNFRADRKIGIAHVRDLILYIVGDAKAPDWIVVEHKSQIKHVVVLLVPGLIPEHLGLPKITPNTNLPFSTSPALHSSSDTADISPSSIPQIQKMFSYGLPTRAPGDQRRMHSVIAMLLQSPLPDELRKQREAKSKQIAELAKSNSFSPLPYILSPNQMIDNDYPMPSYVQSSDERFVPGAEKDIESVVSELPPVGDAAASKLESSSIHSGANGIDTIGSDSRGVWRETLEAVSRPPGGVYPILALDCEMVLTKAGQELARVSVIDFQSNVSVFDHFVKPSHPVTDYRTQWSGITPEKLASATHTLTSIQDALLSGPEALIKPYTILLGHSLECDLNALKIRHPLCIDTALLYRHPRGPPFKSALKYLTQKWLDREIQASLNGHDSEEDARACVDLLKLKMANGPEFGNFADRDESIFERLSRCKALETDSAPSTCYCDSSPNPHLGLGGKATTAPKCSGDEEVIDAMIDNAKSHGLTFGRLANLSVSMEWNDRDIRKADDSSSAAPTAPSVETALSDINRQLARLYTSLPGDTAFILLTGHSDPRPLKEMAAKRQYWERQVKVLGGVEHVPRDERWMSEDDREMEARALEAREGMSFFCVKASQEAKVV